MKEFIPRYKRASDVILPRVGMRSSDRRKKFPRSCKVRLDMERNALRQTFVTSVAWKQLGINPEIKFSSYAMDPFLRSVTSSSPSFGGAKLPSMLMIFHHLVVHAHVSMIHSQHEVRHFPYPVVCRPEFHQFGLHVNDISHNGTLRSRARGFAVGKIKRIDDTRAFETKTNKQGPIDLQPPAPEKHDTVRFKVATHAKRCKTRVGCDLGSCTVYRMVTFK
ncbi:hypothetical protein PsorP6_003603 [Peronosclerospora sorghi]|uniref:Uncharacterized protein n=1 Tax=Peronosclerospora sorghi TaxID=230839 RepID=A0ACC0VKJ5_9STRA|nr:hypothetical protein PsorP6_003603 [Peronosclerospora sorghi]